MSYESAYDCDCLKLADWDSHPYCVSHMGEGHARRLIRRIGAPECRFCFDMSVEQRRQYLGDYILSKNSDGGSKTKDSAASNLIPSHEGSSGSVVWPGGFPVNC